MVMIGFESFVSGMQTPEATKTRGRPRKAITPLKYRDKMSDDEDYFKNTTPKRGRGRPAFKTSIVTPRVGRGRPRLNAATPGKTSVSAPGKTPRKVIKNEIKKSAP
jgi:AT hook motif